MEIISTLGIDVRLIIAQVVSFLILFFILKKLIYRPVLGLLEKRKKMIEQSVEDSKKISDRLTALEEEKGRVLSEASSKAMAVIEKAKHEAEEDRQKVLAAAKKEISSLAERYRAQLKSEKDEMFEELKADIASLIVTSCEKILIREFNQEDQKRLANAIKNELSAI